MEPITKRKKENVPIAEAQKPESSKPEPPAAVPEQPQPNAQAANEEPKTSTPSIMDILQTTDPKILQTAQQLGFPLKPLLEWAISIETSHAELKTIVKAQSQALETLGVKLTPLINLAARAQQAQQTSARANPEAAAQGGGMNLSSIMQLLGPMLSGGSSDNVFTDMGKAWLQRKMQSEDFGDFMSKELFKRVLPDAMQAWEREIIKRAQEKAAGT